MREMHTSREFVGVWEVVKEERWVMKERKKIDERNDLENIPEGFY